MITGGRRPPFLGKVRHNFAGFMAKPITSDI
jgi:hypothetical protein